MDEDRPLFDPELLKELNFDQDKRAVYNPDISQRNPGKNLLMRPLQRTDFIRGYMKLLSQVTEFSEVSREEFEARYSTMASCPDTYYITVIEDTSTSQVIGSASLVKEFKFIPKCSAKARIEDVVVDKTYRGRQLGKLLLDVLVLLAEKLDCYKVSLECWDERVTFYEMFGFVKEKGRNHMLRYFQL